MKTFVRILSAFLLVLVIGLLAGCGGSGSAGRTRAKVVIDWPDISRGVQAPGYAGSAQITLLIGSAQTQSRWFVDRPTGTGAQSISYTSPDLDATGPALLQVSFWERAGANGSQVATASASVKIASDGTLLNSAGGPLGTVSYGQTLNNVQINDSEVAIGESKVLNVYSQGSFGIIAIPPSLVNWTLPDNSHADLQSNTITGTSEGFALVRVSIDSFSQDFAITIVPKPAIYRSVTFPATSIAYDAFHGKIWGTFGPETSYPNSIVEIDPFTGIMGNPIAVGSNPNHLAISADGTTAYVGIDGANALRTVDLTTRTAGTLTSLFAGSLPATANDIKVNPINPNEVMVCLTIQFSGNGWGPAVFRNGSEVGSNSGNIGPFQAGYTSDSTLFGVDYLNGINYSIGLNSVDQVQLVQIQQGGINANEVMTFAGTKALLSSGRVFDTNSITQLGVLSFGSDQLISTATDTTHDTGWAVMMQSFQGTQRFAVRAIDLQSFAPIDSIGLPFTGNFNFPINIRALRYGSNGLAVHFDDKLYLVSNAPGL